MVRTSGFSVLVTHKEIIDTCEIFRDCKAIIPLSSLNVSSLYTIACGFYGSPDEQDWVCELCAFFPESSRILLITQSRLSVTQASSSFECLDTCMPAYATPTFVTEALHVVAYVQLF